MAGNPLNPIAASVWDSAKARHLLNRAGFGVDRARLDELTAAGPDGAVEQLVHYERFPRNFSDPAFVPRPEQYRDEYQAMRALDDDDARRKAQNDFQQAERARMRGLQAWWLERMTTTTRPLEEKMALFWHGHFATSAQKVQLALHNDHLNRIFREFATGNFKQLTMEVGQSPSMLRYLDNNRNVKASPNENWARELMELFTLGVGNYTEKDIKEAARAFTGWSFEIDGFRFYGRRHDTGEKVFMGRTGNWGGEDIIDIIFRQPAAAEFIAGKLCRCFVSEFPDPEMIHGLAQTLRDNDFEIKPVLAQLFRSEGFYAPEAIGAQIKSPAQFVVQLVDDLGLESPPYLEMARASAALGQSLFYPPNVKGWDGGRAWINANSLLVRYNLPKNIATAKPTNSDMMMADGMGMAMTRQQSVRQADVRARLDEIMEEMPDGDRDALRRKFRAAKTQDERRALMARVVRQNGGLSGWKIESVFAALEFKTAGECIEQLQRHFLAVPLQDQQKDVLARALGRQSKESPFTPDDLTWERMNAALHLLLSTAEYQLC